MIAKPCVDAMDRACVDECPVEAIFYEDDLPGERARFLADLPPLSEMGGGG